MRVDSYIESLLRKWGMMPTSVYLGLPRVCPCFREYLPVGYREDCTDIDKDEVERLSYFIAENLTPMRQSVLRVRYRHQIRYKRKAARYMGISEARYREYFEDSIKIIENRF